MGKSNKLQMVSEGKQLRCRIRKIELNYEKAFTSSHLRPLGINSFVKCRASEMKSEKQEEKIRNNFN